MLLAGVVIVIVAAILIVAVLAGNTIGPVCHKCVCFPSLAQHRLFVAVRRTSSEQTLQSVVL